MNRFDAPRRGRPPKPTADPVGSRMRSRREELGLTVRDLAVRAGLKPESASYISQLEAGQKVPNANLARRLAAALRDDPRIYLAWASLGRRSDPVETAQAVHVLAELLRDPRLAARFSMAKEKEVEPDVPTESASARDGGSKLPQMPAAASRAQDPRDVVFGALRESPEAEPLAALTEVASTAFGVAAYRRIRAIPLSQASQAVPPAKILIPEFEEGADPGDGSRPGAREVSMHRIDPDTLSAVEPLMRPFAYRLSEPGVRRVRDVLKPGDIAVLTRRTWPLDYGEPYAVRLSGHAVLSRVLWNGRQLLLLPAEGDNDFMVLDAPDRTALERLLAGKVAATLRVLP